MKYRMNELSLCKSFKRSWDSDVLPNTQQIDDLCPLSRPVEGGGAKYLESPGFGNGNPGPKYQQNFRRKKPMKTQDLVGG